MLKVLDLFSGIGGFSLGLERTGGFETVAFCEIEEFPCKVLAKHWPDVPIYEDVRNVSRKKLVPDGIPIDVITGGFPCQDLSAAGKQKGIEADRSGLWSELWRIIGDVRPKYAIIENVTGLLTGDCGRWFNVVLSDLAKIGYDAEWQCIPACSVGAPHIRDRVWILAYPRQELRADVWGEQRHINSIQAGNGGGGEAEWGQDRKLTPLVPGIHPRASSDWWISQSCMGRTADGLPRQLDRIAACGNAVVPQITEMIGYAILEAEK